MLSLDRRCGLKRILYLLHALVRAHLRCSIGAGVSLSGPGLDASARLGAASREASGVTGLVGSAAAAVVVCVDAYAIL